MKNATPRSSVKIELSLVINDGNILVSIYQTDMVLFRAFSIVGLGYFFGWGNLNTVYTVAIWHFFFGTARLKNLARVSMLNQGCAVYNCRAVLEKSGTIYQGF